MKVCILGEGLTSLTLAKNLANLGITVDIISDKKNIKNKTRTIGISKSNVEFLNKEIFDINKFLWKVNKIEIFTENLKENKVLEFENGKNYLFALFKNDEVLEYLFSTLKKNKFVKFKKKLEIKNYKLIINCQKNTPLSKKFFFNKVKKNYKSFAYISIIKHFKTENNKAVQFFTKRGPLAFLPISETETSIVYSVKGSEKFDLKDMIKKYNISYKIKDISDPSKFKLSSSNLRKYYHNNILAFGDLLHKIHPLAGQGFNMILRDIKEIIKLVKSKKENGLNLDKSICIDFEKNVRNKNYLFSNGIDFIYEFFNFENKLNNTMLSKTVKYFGKNKNINKIFIKIADNGLVI